MKNILILLIMTAALNLASCSAIFTPAEPDTTDELEPRVEPASDDSRYNREVEEEIESDVNPLDTEEIEQQPLIK
ncbi:MAG: hypothetical protein AAF462_10585 [Thermodesulfobacteriota bacterium]